eukprot:12293570-Alexandrium_andersonii.AAC.1
MSASLVGSEMCIRDRCSTAPGSLTAWSSVLRPVGRPLMCRTKCGAALPPVSYTHLTLPTICSV